MDDTSGQLTVETPRLLRGLNVTEVVVEARDGGSSGDGGNLTVKVP